MPRLVLHCLLPLVLLCHRYPAAINAGYCGKYSGLQGMVRSPQLNALTGLYPPNTRCDYRVKAPRGYTIRASFEDFNLQWSSNCQSDYVMHSQNRKKWSRPYCGQHLKGRAVETCDNKLFIRFVSDGVANGRGFRMAYQAVDIDECSSSLRRGCRRAVGRSVCQQICINTPGSYRCACRNGFRLSVDGRNCDQDPQKVPSQRVKVGQCPKKLLGQAQDSCRSGDDSSCPGMLKCCLSKSGHRCKEPTFAFQTPDQLSKALKTNLLSLTKLPVATGRVSGSTSGCQPTCLTVLLDRSGSIGFSNFRLMLNFLSSLLTSMCTRTPCLSTLAISYASNVRVELECGQYKCGQELYEAVRDIRYRSGFTYLDLALESARNMMTGPSTRGCGRSSGNCQQIVFVLTDGKSNGNRDPVMLARQLERDTGAKIFTFGVTENVNGSELSAVASQELVTVNGSVINNNVFMSRTFKALDDLANILNEPEDPCSANNGGCEQLCVNNSGTAQCGCRDGFTPVSQGSPVCKQDVHPCNQHARGGCHHNCVAQGTQFVCSCREGYQLGSDQKSCNDVDECQQSNGHCSQQCVNTVGSFRCECHDGFSLQRSGRCERKCHIADRPGDCRVRKDFYSMTSQERERFFRVFKLITTQPPYKRLYDDLIAIHEREFDNGIHSPQQFLPWHRWFVVAVENLLRCADPTVTIPYWDYSYTCRSPWDPNTSCLDNLWGHNLRSLGGNGTGRFHRVVTGPFAYPGWTLSSSAATDALRRSFRDRDLPCLPALQRFRELPCTRGTIQDIDVALAGPLHSPVHFGINGTMWSRSSANAPEFYLLHSFIDKLWHEWQSKGRNCAEQYTTATTFVLTATGGVTIRDMQRMNEMVVNGTVVCVRYDEPSHCLAKTVLGRLAGTGKSWHSITRLPALQPTRMTVEEAMFTGRNHENVQRQLDMDKKLQPLGPGGRSSTTPGWNREEQILGFKLSSL